ncbi:DHH family phosphoesterase [Alkalicoccus saliphilus]|nr:bifunctional oligoribonuclease/PAP phosphatase NrnA [Alkalicoccus saliphilus]
MSDKIMENIWKAVFDFETIIIHRHVRPDPDAVGSQAALKEMITASWPEKKVLLAGETQQSLTFLAEMDPVQPEDYKEALVIVCDTANTARVDGEGWDKGEKLIKIDHHPEVERYGNYQWVMTEASSTCEMLFLLAEQLDVPLTDEAARLLYAGIVADTGRFRFPNTTAATFSSAGKLIGYNFDRSSLLNEMEEKSQEILRLEGYVLSTVEVSANGAAQVILTEDTLRRFSVTAEDTAAVVNSFSTLKGLKAWVFFVEEPDVIRVRMRSKKPEIHELAADHQGGGHPMAAGAKAESWKETEEIFQKLDILCRETAL